MTTPALAFQPDAMTPAQQAAVSYLARYSGHTHTLYGSQLRRWFAWCETNGLDPLLQRAHIELYIRHLGVTGLMASSVNTSMHAVRGFFRYAHIDGPIGPDPAVYARLPKVHLDECDLSRSWHPGCRRSRPGAPRRDRARLLTAPQVRAQGIGRSLEQLP
jgi:integrase/recombinase XerD